MIEHQENFLRLFGIVFYNKYDQGQEDLDIDKIRNTILMCVESTAKIHKIDENTVIDKIVEYYPQKEYRFMYVAAAKPGYMSTILNMIKKDVEKYGSPAPYTMFPAKLSSKEIADRKRAYHNRFSFFDEVLIETALKNPDLAIKIQKIRENAIDLNYADKFMDDPEIHNSPPLRFYKGSLLRFIGSELLLHRKIEKAEYYYNISGYGNISSLDVEALHQLHNKNEMHILRKFIEENKDFFYAKSPDTVLTEYFYKVICDSNINQLDLLFNMKVLNTSMSFIHNGKKGEISRIDLLGWAILCESVPSYLYLTRDRDMELTDAHYKLIDSLKDTRIAELAGRILQRVIYILRGPDGSGREKLAKSIQKKEGGVILSINDYFTTNGNYKYIPNKLNEAQFETIDKTDEAMNNNITPIIIDNPNIKRWEAKPYVELAGVHKYKVIVLEALAPEKFNINQMMKKSIHKVPRSIIEKQIHRYEPIEKFSIKQILNSKTPWEYEN